MIFFAIRSPYYFSDQGGYRTKNADILNHYYVVESLIHGELFPDWNKLEISEHAISNRLPVYHGLILAHSLSAVLVLLGVPLPGSVLLVSDLAFLFVIFLWFFWAQGKSDVTTRLLLVFSLTMICYVYLVQLSGAYFSQTVGMAFGLLLFYFIAKRKAPYFCLLFLFVAAFAYPDTILVLGPLLVGPLWKNRHRFESALVCLLWLACLWVFIHRFGLPGPLNFDYSASVILLFVFLGYKFFFFEKKLTSPIHELFFIYLGVLIALAIYSLAQLGGLNYYLNKFSAWSYIILPIVIYQIWDWKKQFLIVVLFFLFFFSGIGNEAENKILLVETLQNRQINYLSNRAWNEIHDLISRSEFPKNKNVTPWFSETDEKDLNMNLMSFLSIARAYNLTSSLIKSEIFKIQNDGKPLGFARVHEKIKEIGTQGAAGLMVVVQLLESHPDEVLVIPKAKWTPLLTPHFKFKSVATDKLIAIWKE